MRIPWNKGKRGSQVAWNKGLKGIGLGIKNGMWKQNGVSYRGLHSWVIRMAGYAHKCDMCGLESDNHRKIHWANVSGEYHRDLSDYISLCVSCHRKYDANHGTYMPWFRWKKE